MSRYVPGVLLCVAISGLAWLGERAERALTGHAWIETLVLAILVGTAVRAIWTPGERWRAGIDLSAKQILEIAVVLLGLTLDVPVLLRAGPLLLAGVVVAVGVALAGGYGVGRALGLHRRLALLVACGNAICGNSAIAAIAPVIGAEPADIGSSIAYTAVLGIGVVLALPLLIVPFGLSMYQYGVLAGLTVYSVPQVLAATLPVSAMSGQVGALVKLVRVLMLGPVVFVLSLGAGRSAPRRIPVTRLVPWFIIGFLALAALRAGGVIPAPAIEAARTISLTLTIVSMAALGLGVDVRILRRVGGPVILAACGSLALLLSVSLLLLRRLPVPPG